MEVVDSPAVQKYLKKRNLIKVYRKVKKNIYLEQYSLVDLKIRHPKKAGIYQFRITKKYRAYAFKEDNKLLVFKISDHQ